jgi:regulator of nucleoside diphosphate kinase
MYGRTQPKGLLPSVAIGALTLAFGAALHVIHGAPPDSARLLWALLLAVASLVAACLLGRATRTYYGAAAWLAALALEPLVYGAATPVLGVASLLLLLLGAVCFERDLPLPQGLLMTDLDVQRLNGMLSALETSHGQDVEALQAELERATVVPCTTVPTDVVTMNSRIVFMDLESGQLQEATLVYPHDADPAAGRVSILAPLGRALLGLRVGQSIVWQRKSGPSCHLRIASLAYQPEAAGDFHL